jgi:hypothetical protein
MIWADAVELDVERVKPGAGIDQHGEGLDLIVRLDAGQADLADAGGITASGFDIQRDKAETAIWHTKSVRECRSGWSAGNRGGPKFLSRAFGLVLLGRLRGAAEQPVKKCHAETTP